MPEWNEVEREPALPKTIRFCKACAKETPHQIRSGGGVIAVVCVPCLEEALAYELERD